MGSTRHIKYATDLITFYNAAWWGQTDPTANFGNLFARGNVTPEQFWDRILTNVVDAGLEGIELTFPPGDYRCAIGTFGSAEGFATEVRARNLEVASGYFSNRSADGRVLDWENPDHHGELVEGVTEYAQFLELCRCQTIVVSLMLRKNRDSVPPLFADHHRAEIAWEVCTGPPPPPRASVLGLPCTRKRSPYFGTRAMSICT